jgi:glucosamine--fructose-6-phosphate aminotransferase (isomerizing)
VAISNVMDSTLARESDGVFYTHAGPEIGVAASKTFTTQLVSLYLLGLALGANRAHSPRREASSCARPPADATPDGRSAGAREAIAEMARQFATKRDFLFLGRVCRSRLPWRGAEAEGIILHPC